MVLKFNVNGLMEKLFKRKIELFYLILYNSNLINLLGNIKQFFIIFNIKKIYNSVKNYQKKKCFNII